MRAHIRSEIASIDPLDEVERAHQLDALAWVDSGAPLIRTEKPATPAKHLVSYFAIVDATRILLVDHRNAMLWLPPGGHVEIDETPRATVVREIKEELALNVSLAVVQAPQMVTVTKTVGHSALHVDVSLWYVLRMSHRTKMVFDEAEFQSIKWFEFDEIPFERAEPHLRRFIKKLS